MNAPLPHVYPQWAPPLDDPSADPEYFVEVFYGHMRIVHNRRRAKLLRDRGVPMWRAPDGWLWFTELTERERQAAYAARMGEI